MPVSRDKEVVRKYNARRYKERKANGTVIPSKSHLKKSEQLGMPWGTAAHRLRKKVLFMLVCEAGRNICFHCGGEIENESDLSIEHKQSWLGIDVDLFWDMENIDFSHLRCNSSRSPNP